MAIKVKAQKSYYVTEVSIDLPASAKEVEEFLKSMNTNGKMTVVYSGGNTQGLSFEQRTHIPISVDEGVRRIIGIPTKLV